MSSQWLSSAWFCTYSELCVVLCCVQYRRNFFTVHTLMWWCWTQDPAQRPDFTQVLRVLQSELFLRLVHHVRVTKKLTIMTGCIAPRQISEEEEDILFSSDDQRYLEVWLSNSIGQISIVECFNKTTKVEVRFMY